MKKKTMQINVLVFLFTAVLALMCSCASSPQKKINDFNIEITSEVSSFNVSVQVLAVNWKSSLLLSEGIQSVFLQVKNSSNGVARIIWDKSSINYNGSSYAFFLDGMKYIDAGKAPPITVIPKGGSIERLIYSSEQPNYTAGQYGGWSMRPMAASIQLLLCVEADKTENYFTISISLK